MSIFKGLMKNIFFIKPIFKSLMKNKLFIKLLKMDPTEGSKTSAKLS
jgi:hypothetical protein